MAVYAGPRDASPVLTLAELQSFDPEGQHHRGRYLCPLPGCGEGKPRDNAHRSLKVELRGGMDQGLWHCHRCGHGGRLREFWAPLPPSRQARERLRARRATTLPPTGISCSGVAAASDTDRSAEVITAAYARARPLAATAGAAYLAGRGIPLTLAEAAGLRLGVDRQGYPAVLFPIRGESGATVALAARYITDDAPVRMRTLGPASAGVFAAPYTRPAPIAITEAPIDALSLGAAGLPAIALGGTKNRPSWLRRRLAERTVLLATDADAAGETAAHDLATWLSFGTRCRRLRPSAGCKDWNEVLQARGLVGLVQLLEPLMADGGGDV